MSAKLPVSNMANSTPSSQSVASRTGVRPARQHSNQGLPLFGVDGLKNFEHLRAGVPIVGYCVWLSIGRLRWLSNPNVEVATAYRMDPDVPIGIVKVMHRPEPEHGSED